MPVMMERAWHLSQTSPSYLLTSTSHSKRTSTMRRAKLPSLSTREKTKELRTSFNR